MDGLVVVKGLLFAYTSGSYAYKGVQRSPCKTLADSFLLLDALQFYNNQDCKIRTALLN